MGGGEGGVNKQVARLGVWLMALLGLWGSAALWAADPGVYPRESREAAREWYLRWWPRGHVWNVGFTGDLATLRAGDTSPEWKEAMETRINLFRRVAGLSPIGLKAEYNRLCQAGALILGAKGESTHAPPSTWPGWTSEGYEGCQKSEISYRYHPFCPVQVLMHDFGEESLGHRQHLLTPGLRWMGVGAAPDASRGAWIETEKVLIHTADPSLATRDPAYIEPFVCWPAPGFIPKAMLPNRWTIDLADLSLPEEMSLDLRAATAVVTRNGKTLPALVKSDPFGARLVLILDGDKKSWGGYPAADTFPVPFIYGMPAVGSDLGYGESTGAAITSEDPFGDVDYHVEVRGIRHRVDGSPWPAEGVFAYDVHAFDHQSGPPLPGQARLINLSTRAPVRTGSGVMVGGFVVAGTRPQTFLLRAAGPALTAFGVEGVLPDPVLTVHRLPASGPAELVVTNDNWSGGPGGAASLREVMQRVGAFAWPEGSRDAALVITLAPGNYSATVTGADGVVGNGLVEIYDAEAGQGEGHLVNLSARTYVGEGGSDVQIAGFILRGELPRTVFLRATGPDLAQFGIRAPLPHLQMELYEGEHFVAAAEGVDSFSGSGKSAPEDLTDFQNGSAWARRRRAEALVGAFPSAQGNYAVAMVQTLLPDRLYTLVVQSSTWREAVAGHALVEVYEMP